MKYDLIFVMGETGLYNVWAEVTDGIKKVTLPLPFNPTIKDLKDALAGYKAGYVI